MTVISSPAACSERIAASLPAPGPLTYTSADFIPCSIALRATASAAICAANGVDFFEPLNPRFPAEAQAIVLPWLSVTVTIVLLKDEWLWAIPELTFLNSRFFRVFACFLTANYSPFRAVRGPLRAREEYRRPRGQATSNSTR